VYAGGNFHQAGTCTDGCNNIAQWNGSTWSPMDSGMNSQVYAILASGSSVYAGGYFANPINSINCMSGCPHIAQWDGSHWSGLGSGMDDSVNAIAVSGDSVYAGGAFTIAGTCTSGCSHIAKYAPPPHNVFLPLIRR
jgi:hypothetical protein